MSLVFVISPPRAGSTLLQRMMGAHSEIFTHPEPHLITPIAHLGVYDNVDKAPYDHINAAEAMKAFIRGLPRGEQDYLGALRAYTDALYGRMLSTSESSYFLDKTPANALVLPFLQRLYPDAKYVVLTRHPLAVFSSYANSFFDGDWTGAHAFNPILERYVPAMAAFLRERPVPLLHVAYEDLVMEPAAQLERIFAFLGLENDPEAVEYGKAAPPKRGMGDPITVDREDRPVADKIDKWAAELANDAGKRALAEQMIARIDPVDLDAWQWPSNALWAPVEMAGGAPPPKPARNSYTFQRRLMLALKKDIHSRPHGRLVKRVKYYCDVLLRD
ncbi:MAG: sulfotransferase [Deltaproteobacteria bacterium]|nr:sulfotransferase [Deltaproteobacteria bacterium]NND30733.1 sulfotransferase [Myxococcales bacterium]MBT8465255.1 sulfotransferase [Deltaproteobacteria bacterium]MBT8482491.1 sulfotransferase [Deltaproteobacteria bacterium]NNK09115.1 sulfotransferase [Myxococcales bacterium]